MVIMVTVTRQQMPVSLCTARCPHCGMPTDPFPFFGSDPGGEFETWQVGADGVLFRVDCTMITCGVASRDEALAAMKNAASTGESLRQLPDRQICKLCKTTFVPGDLAIESESQCEVFVVGP